MKSEFELQEKKTTNILLFLLLFTYLSGVFRKWIFPDPTIGNIIFFIQIIVPYLFLFNGSNKLKNLVNQKLLVFFLFYLLLSAVNPLQKTLFHGAIGIIFHFSFWFLSFYYVENRKLFDIRKIITIVVVLAFIQLALAFEQYSLPQTHILNRYASEKNVGGIIAEVGDSVRVTGTFSYISGFSAYLIFHVFLVWALIIYEYKPAITITLMLGGLVACFMNGSRGSTYLYLAIIMFFFFFESKKTNIAKHIGKLFFPLVIIILLFLNKGETNFTQFIGKAYNNFELRRGGLAESGEEKSRIFGDFINLANFKGQYPYFGIGIGAAYQGSLILFGSSDALLDYGFIESELEKYVLEGGFILLTIRVLLTIALCKKLFMPSKVKILIGLLCFFTPITYNIFNIVFFLISIVFIDQMYYRKYLNSFTKS